MTRFVRLILPLALVIFANGAQAANLLVNSDFQLSNSMAGWTYELEGSAPEVCTTDPICGYELSSDECCGMTGSGSVAARSGLLKFEALTQCVTPVVPDTTYDAGAYMRITSSIGFNPGLPAFGVYWYATTDCSGATLPSGGGSGQRNSSSTSWARIAYSGAIAPSTARSAKFLLIPSLTGDSGTAVNMEFDSAFFGPSGTVPIELQSFSVD